MLGFEIRKVFSRTANKIAMLILAVMLGVVCFFAIEYVSYVDEEGNSSSGYAQAALLREERNRWAGYVTEEKLVKMLEENAKINASEEYNSQNVTENNKAFAKKQGFSDIRGMVSRAFSAFREYDYYRADSVKAEEVGTLYERRISNLEDWLNSDEAKDLYTQKEKEYLLTKYRQLETPLYYEYESGWNALLEYAPTMIMLILLILSFLVAGIFSNEFQLKAEDIFFSSKLGRDRAVACKIGAGLLIVTVVYWLTMCAYSAIVLLTLGTDGGNCAIQIGLGGWKSFYNITYLQDFFLTMLGGYAGCLFILILTMTVSACTHSTVIAVTVPFFLLFLPSFLGGISVLSKVLGLLPDQLLQMNNVVTYFNLYEIGGKVTGAVPILFVLYLLLSAVLLPVLYRVYQKTEVK